MNLVTIRTFDNPLEAHMVKTQLESADILSVLKDENLVGLNPLFNITLGGIKLQVNGKDEEEALAILQDLKQAEQDQLICPNCKKSNCYVDYKSIKSHKGVFATIISLLTGTYPPLSFEVVNKCKECGHEYSETSN
ncbi:MAG: hypothetical protein ACI8SE_000086 [Bacteroidia bacterium]|jgi:hypothetical protein